LGLSSPNRLRVLLYHDIAPNTFDRFAAQLRWLSRNWNFVTPQQFSDMVAGRIPIIGSNLLLTFDDGFISNRLVAEQVLNPMGISGLFFVVPDFVEMKDQEEARRFIAKHIEPESKIEKMSHHLYNMNWTDLEKLIEQGHTIGCHTYTHERLSRITSEEELEYQIIASADDLSRRLMVPIEHFAYTFGDLASFSEQALIVARRRFNFIYSGLRGDNSGGVSPFALRRDSITTNDSMALLGAFLEGAADFHYASACTQLDNWVNKNANNLL